MVVNLIVAVVTLLMTGFLVIWIFFPRLRGWMEMPKYRFLEQQSRFPPVSHDGLPGPEDSSICRD